MLLLLPRILTRSSLTSTLTILPSLARSSSTMPFASPTPTSTLTLPATFWNPSLYNSVYTFWFTGLDASSKRQNAITKKRWWGMGRSEQDLAELDEECRQKFGEAVESIGPENVRLPEWAGYEKERESAGEISRAFMHEVENAKQAGGEREAADRLLSLILSLDQIPRHMFRDEPGLRKVYGHYDRLAWSLLQTARTQAPTLLSHPFYRERPVYASWFLMPLMHSEDLVSQEAAYAEIAASQKSFEEEGDVETARDMEANLKAAKSHLDIVRRFGRFCHRNEALGRTSTREEEEWLKTVETFGVKQKGKEKEKEKEEL